MPIRYAGGEVNAIRYAGADVTSVFYPLSAADENPSAGDAPDAFAPSTSGTFLFEHAMVTVTIDAAGNVTVSAVLAADNSVMITATTTADFTASSPVNTATDRSVQVDLVVPTISPAFDNEGDTVTGVLTVAQTVDPLDTCNIGDWTNSGGTFRGALTNNGSCNAPTSFTDASRPCVETETRTGTRTRTYQTRQNQVRTVTRVVNGLQDLTNPCSGVATSQTITVGSQQETVGCSVTATNTAYGGDGTEDGGVDQPTVWSGDCTGVDTSVGCCPDATCTGSGTEAGTIETIFTTTRNCDGSFVSSRSTTRNTSRACTDTYPNPDTCGCTGTVSATTDSATVGSTDFCATVLVNGCSYTINSTTGSAQQHIAGSRPTAGTSAASAISTPVQRCAISGFGVSIGFAPVDGGMICSGTGIEIASPGAVGTACSDATTYTL